MHNALTSCIEAANEDVLPSGGSFASYVISDLTLQTPVHLNIAIARVQGSWACNLDRLGLGLG